MLSACTSYPVDKSLHTIIVGVWKGDTSGAVMTILSDGRFTIEHASNLPADVTIKGTLERGRDQIRFAYSIPSSACPGENGIYHFVREDDTLKLDAVHEECRLRAEHMDSSWTLVSMITGNE